MTTRTRFPAHVQLLSYLSVEKVPPGMRPEWLAPFLRLGESIVDNNPQDNSSEVTVALRKLIECRDAVIRAYLVPVTAAERTSFE